MSTVCFKGAVQTWSYLSWITFHRISQRTSFEEEKQSSYLMTSRNSRKEKEANEWKWQEMINWRSRYPRHFSSGWMEIAWRKVQDETLLKGLRQFFWKLFALWNMTSIAPTFKANRLSFDDKSFSLKKQLLKIYKVAGISIVLVLPASIKSRPSRGAPIHHLSSPEAACNLWSHKVERVTRWEIVQNVYATLMTILTAPQQNWSW